MYFNTNYYNFYIYSAIIYIITFFLYFFFTKFKRVITIKDDFVMGLNKNVFNVISDTNNNVYVIDNRYLLLHFDAVETIAMIEKGRTYTITGYGLRIPFLNLYENIISCVPNKIK